MLENLHVKFFEVFEKTASTKRLRKNATFLKHPYTYNFTSTKRLRKNVTFINIWEKISQNSRTQLSNKTIALIHAMLEAYILKM